MIRMKEAFTMPFQESATLECKREYTEGIKKTIIAFANTKGGELFIGIGDDGTVFGVEDADDTMLRLSNTVRDSIMPDVTLFVQYKAIQIKGKTVVRAAVEKGTGSPYYLKSKGLRPEGVYIRQGASTVPATETAILHMIWETDGERFENARSINQELTFDYAAKEFATHDMQFNKEQMRTLGLIAEDGIYTNLGLLLSDQCAHSMKLAVFEGEAKAVFKDRREFTGSLLKQLYDAYECIDRYNRTRAEFSGLHRVDIRDYPEEALREALLNALVHREYAYSASTLISIFDDRIEFVSIGGLVRDISFNDIMLGISVTRNEKLANVFYRLKLIEAYGTGIPKILRSYEEYHLKPDFEVSDNAFRITLPNTNESKGSAVELTANERAVLQLFDIQESITRKDVEKELAVSQAMAVRILKGLVEKKALHIVGGGKNTRYVQE